MALCFRYSLRRAWKIVALLCIVKIFPQSFLNVPAKHQQKTPTAMASVENPTRPPNDVLRRAAIRGYGPSDQKRGRGPNMEGVQ